MKLTVLRAIAILSVLTVGVPPVLAQRLPVAGGTELVIRLEDRISSKTSRPGDRFIATVTSPAAYGGAAVEGHVSRVEESGRLKGKTEMGLSFDRIRLRDGRATTLEAEMVELRSSDKVKVIDEEGNVETGSRGEQAIKRTAIGAAIGGVLGGLIGGRKGLAIGLIVGAGAGAGSLVIDGSKELRLERGTEMVIRVEGGSDSAQVVGRPLGSGVSMLIRLQDTISSKSSREGDRFTASVVSPATYRGATVHGRVARIEESGRFQGRTEVGLEFDHIVLRNGQSRPFYAEIVEVRQSDSVKAVDEEGNVVTGTRGGQTIRRTAIGAAAGGVLGGLIGGRKGIAIGLVIGAGAGAGSLLIDGKKELKLEPGTEILVRTVRAYRRS